VEAYKREKEATAEARAEAYQREQAAKAEAKAEVLTARKTSPK